MRMLNIKNTRTVKVRCCSKEKNEQKYVGERNELIGDGQRAYELLEE